MEDGLAHGQELATDALDDDKSLLIEDRKAWIRRFRDSLKTSTDFQTNKLRSAWGRNYRAFNNRHPSGTKYETFKYRHRSKLFKPKTRMAVRKNDATAASAMFSTADVVNIEAERKSDRKQVMVARFVHAALNYRLDRSTAMTGPNWFLTAIGARQDTQLTGVCVTKQYWEFEEVVRDEIADVPAMDQNGIPLTMIDPMTGMEAPVMEEDVVEKRKVLADRIMIANIPPELAFIDSSADWRDPIQTGGFFIAAFPVRQEDLETMIANGAERAKMGGGQWRTDLNIKDIMSARGGEAKRNERVRRARDDGGIDRYDSRLNNKDGETIWLYECFYRYDGDDWHFWMLGEHIILSEPQLTEESYPEQEGARPYVMGLGALETHKTHPTAPVETWMPLQQEMNDITNLTLDARKMAISPITKIRRGRNIDFKQVQNRGPDAMIMVEEEDDVTFDRAPDPSGAEQQTINNLTVDFDELAGVFSTGSVQSNRQLNETVGGMNLMAGSANSLTEFDLRVWVETWAEPVLRQCCNLIRYYESDETVIAVAGENAGLIVTPQSQPKPPGPLDPQSQQDMAQPPITIEEALDGLLNTQISVKVNVGIGAMDTRQKLEKFGGAMKMTMEAAPLLAASGIKPKGSELMQEAWGLFGYKDADRFFEPMPPPDPNAPPPPEVQIKQMEVKGKELDLQSKQAEVAGKAQEREFQAVENQKKAIADRENMALQHTQGIEKLKGDADAKRMEAGLPSDETFKALVDEMNASRAETSQMLAMMMQQMAQSQQQFQQAMIAVQQAITAPKSVTTPDGRTYTAVTGDTQ